MNLRLPVIPLLAVLWVGGGAGAAADSGIPIALTCVNAVSCAVEGFLIARHPTDKSAETRIAVSGGTARFPGDAPRTWELELLADGFWMPKRSVESRPGETVTVEV